jgi:hypothetical protein
MRIDKFLLRSIIPATLLFSACACSTEPDIQKVLGKSAEATVFLDCRPLSAGEIAFQFSRPVKVVSLSFDPAAEVESVEEGKELRVSLTAPLKSGEKITADLLVEDEDRNTLNVLVPFRARNDRMPSLMITELRTEYSKPRAEFVELKILSGGNLGAMRLFLAGRSISVPVYEFPPADVRAGEYIVLHLRTTQEGWIDETGEDLSLSAGADALAAVRDFWVNGTEKLIHKTDAVYLMDQDDTIIDGVLLSENQEPWWTKPDFAAAAELFAAQGVWFPVDESGNTLVPEDGWIPAPGDAAQTTGTTSTRTVCRDETAENSTAAWYITATSGHTPGKENSGKRYVK